MVCYVLKIQKKLYFSFDQNFLIAKKQSFKIFLCYIKLKEMAKDFFQSVIIFYKVDYLNLVIKINPKKEQKINISSLDFKKIEEVFF